MNNEKDRIKQMYERVNTPKYDVKDKVLDEIRNSQRGMRINRKVLITAVACIVLLLAGTAVGAGMANLQVFRFPDQNAQIGDAEPLVTPAPTPVPGPEDINYIDTEDIYYKMYQFMDGTQPNEYRTAYYFDNDDPTSGGGGAECISSLAPIEDLSEVKSRLKNSVIPMPIPSYIPKGYEFRDASLGLFMDYRMYNAEPSEQWSEEGITYLIFMLPEGYERNIAHYAMHFENAEGMSIHIIVNVFPMETHGFHDFGASESATAEYVNIKGYGESLLIYDEQKAYGYLYELAMNKQVEPVELFEMHCKVYDEATQLNLAEQNYTTVLEDMMIVISADDLSRREILKVGKGME